MALSKEDKKAGRYAAVRTLNLREDEPQQVLLEAVPFALLVVKRIFENDDGWTGTGDLVTSDLTLTSEQIAKFFQRRWSVEVYHRSLRQNASLEKSPTRSETTQGNHLYTSLWAYVKLEGLKIRMKTMPFALKSKIYLAA